MRVDAAAADDVAAGRRERDLAAAREQRRGEQDRRADLPAERADRAPRRDRSCAWMRERVALASTRRSTPTDWMSSTSVSTSRMRGTFSSVTGSSERSAAATIGQRGVLVAGGADRAGERGPPSTTYCSAAMSEFEETRRESRRGTANRLAEGATGSEGSTRAQERSRSRAFARTTSMRSALLELACPRRDTIARHGAASALHTASGAGDRAARAVASAISPTQSRPDDSIAHDGGRRLAACRRAARCRTRSSRSRSPPAPSWFERITAIASGLLDDRAAGVRGRARAGRVELPEELPTKSTTCSTGYGDINPLMRHASAIADNVNYITTSVRADVQQVNATIAAANQRLQQAVLVTEQRLSEFNALLQVVQQEAEEMFVSTASAMRGVRTSAAALSERGRWDEPCETGIDDDWTSSSWTPKSTPRRSSMMATTATPRRPTDDVARPRRPSATSRGRRRRARSSGSSRDEPMASSTTCSRPRSSASRSGVGTTLLLRRGPSGQRPVAPVLSGAARGAKWAGLGAATLGARGATWARDARRASCWIAFPRRDREHVRDYVGKAQRGNRRRRRDRAARPPQARSAGSGSARDLRVGALSRGTARRAPRLVLAMLRSRSSARAAAVDGVRVDAGHAHLSRRGRDAVADLLPAAIAELLRAFPYDFLYGSIAADTSIAKKYAPVGRHCHSWTVGLEIYDGARRRTAASLRVRLPRPPRRRRRRPQLLRAEAARGHVEHVVARPQLLGEPVRDASRRAVQPAGARRDHCSTTRARTACSTAS